MKCLLLINTSSGNAARVVDNPRLKETLLAMYDAVDEIRITEHDRDFDLPAALKGYGALAVCGGDGTFHNTLNAVRDLDVELMYVPCGTFNDAAKTLKLGKALKADSDRLVRRIDLGDINGRLFSYVAAAGSFTPIGYIPNTKYKKLFKRFVYYFYAFKEFRIHRIPARIRTDSGLAVDKTFSLIMAINSKYCFGFPFNRRFSHNNGKAQLLLIEAPEGCLRYVRFFLRFFRAFFIGFNKEYRGKHVTFVDFTSATVDLDAPVEFCVDGERFVSETHNTFFVHQRKGKLFLL